MFENVDERTTLGRHWDTDDFIRETLTIKRELIDLAAIAR